MLTDLKPYPAMKDSGVPRLGDVPGHWEAQQLGRFGRLSKGNGGTKEDDAQAGVPCVRYGDLYTQHQFFIQRTRACVPKERASDYTRILYGDILFAASGETIEEIGKSAVNLIESQACCGGDVIVFRPAISLHARFMGYAADCWQASFQKSSMGRGITVMHIYGDQLKYMSVALPPLPEQAAIARFLDHADRQIRRYIRSKQKLIKLLEEQKRVIIHRAVTRGLDPSVRLKPSGVEWLGDVPEHWDVRPLKHVVPAVTVGIVIQPARLYVESGVPCLRSLNISSGSIDSGKLVFISPKSNDEHRKSQIFSGDVVIVRTGQAGVAAIVTPEFDGANCIDLLIVRQSESLLSEYLLMYLNSWPARTEVQYRSVGAIQAHYNTSTLKNLMIPVPPLPEQRKALDAVSHEVSRLAVTVGAAQREIALLREYRSRLISDVVTGKLDVRDAAAQLPEDSEEPEVFEDTESIEAEEDPIDDLDAVPDGAEA